jgi:Uma2 family endonuclease
MTAMPAAQAMTAREYMAVPPETFPWATSLVDGQVVMGEPTRLHQHIALELAYALETWIREAPGRGAVSLPIDIGIDERNVYAPDLSWYAEGRDPMQEKPPYAVPDIVAEVRSPTTWRYDIGAKKAGYERQGLPELWLVDTAASEVIVFRRSAPDAAAFDVSERFGREDVLTSPRLPGFELPLEQLF